MPHLERANELPTDGRTISKYTRVEGGREGGREAGSKVDCYLFKPASATEKDPTYSLTLHHRDRLPLAQVAPEGEQGPRRGGGDAVGAVGLEFLGKVRRTKTVSLDSGELPTKVIPGTF